MDKKQSLELFQRGKHAWNTWADKMVADKMALEEAGVWKEIRTLWNEQTRAWHEKAKADFRNIDFQTFADFIQFRFPGDALFRSANFPKGVNFASGEFLNNANFSELEFGGLCVFASASFCGAACFQKTTFKGEARFRNAKFLGIDDVNFEDVKFIGPAHFGRVRFGAYSLFDGASFSGLARFDDALFSDGASFHHVTFSRHAIFDRAKFSKNVVFDHSFFEDFAYFDLSSFGCPTAFRAVRGKAIVLDNPKFSYVPDFSGAHFEEAPVLDNVDLEPERLGDTSADSSRFGLPARWRALRRLAIQGHDHERELQFFKGEVIARRGTHDTWVHLWFWMGWAYQILSDFGRSMTRPLLGLGLSVVAFAFLYAIPNHTVWDQPFAKSIPCEVGSGDPRLATLLLSLHNAVPVAGIASTGKIREVYACLYGLEAITALTQGNLPSNCAPIIPYGVVFAGVCQSVLSVAFIFLVLLAIRNRFRIR